MKLFTFGKFPPIQHSSKSEGQNCVNAAQPESHSHDTRGCNLIKANNMRSGEIFNFNLQDESTVLW